MSPHTPEPWIIVRKRVTVSIQTIDGDYITENVRQLPNQEANALLIAASPKLLKALKELVTAVAIEVNEKGGGGFILARLSDAESAIKEAGAQ